MAFQFRRGTDAERQSITPDLGEPLFVTDTGKVYVGDGSTVGGIIVSSEVSDDTSPELSGNLDLNGNDIVGTGNINIDGFITATGNINLGDGAEDNIIVGGVISSSLIPADDRVYDLGTSTSAWRNGFFEGINVNGEIAVNSLSVNSIYNRDSSILFDSDDSSINVQNAFINELLTVENLLATSIYSDDSTIFYDSNSNIATANFKGDLLDGGFNVLVNSQTGNADFQNVNASTVLSNIISPLSGNNISLENGVQQISTSLTINSIDNVSDFSLYREFEEDTGSYPGVFGRIGFGRTSPQEDLTTSILLGTNTGFFIGSGLSTPGEGTENKFLTWESQRLGIGTYTPAATLDVNGSANIQGDLTANSLKGTIVGDDSSIIIDGIDNTIISGGFIQFGSYTDANRPQGINGMVIYNSTTNKFQGYQNNNWINLDDGSLA